MSEQTELPPKVQFGLLGEEYFVTDFIQTKNPALIEIARKIKTADVNEAIMACAAYTAKTIHYAVDRNQRPAATRHSQVFKFFGPIYLVDTGERPYGWLMPNQACVAGYGICFDTTAFCTTLLRIKGVRALVTLGAVLRSKDQKLLGFHAWVEAFTKDNLKVVIETTSPKPSVLKADDIYLGKMPSRYDPICWFHEAYWHEDKVKAQKYVEFAVNALREIR